MALNNKFYLVFQAEDINNLPDGYTVNNNPFLQINPIETPIIEDPVTGERYTLLTNELKDTGIELYEDRIIVNSNTYTVNRIRQGIINVTNVSGVKITIVEVESVDLQAFQICLDDTITQCKGKTFLTANGIYTNNNEIEIPILSKDNTDKNYYKGLFFLFETVIKNIMFRDLNNDESDIVDIDIFQTEAISSINELSIQNSIYVSDIANHYYLKFSEYEFIMTNYLIKLFTEIDLNGLTPESNIVYTDIIDRDASLQNVIGKIIFKDSITLLNECDIRVSEKPLLDILYQFDLTDPNYEDFIKTYNGAINDYAYIAQFGITKVTFVNIMTDEEYKKYANILYEYIVSNNSTLQSSIYYIRNRNNIPINFSEVMIELVDNDSAMNLYLDDKVDSLFVIKINPTEMATIYNRIISENLACATKTNLVDVQLVKNSYHVTCGANASRIIESELFRSPNGLDGLYKNIYDNINNVFTTSIGEKIYSFYMNIFYLKYMAYDSESVNIPEFNYSVINKIFDEAGTIPNSGLKHGTSEFILIDVLGNEIEVDLNIDIVMSMNPLGNLNSSMRLFKMYPDIMPVNNISNGIFDDITIPEICMYNFHLPALFASMIPINMEEIKQLSISCMYL